MTNRSLLPRIARALGGRPCFLVGGYLRDLLLGRPSKDLDFVAPEPEQAAQAVAAALGRPLVRLSERWARYRVPWRQLTLDFTALRGHTLEEDLRQRDFTIDALGAPLAEFAARGSEAIVDPCGGRADLERRVVRLAYPQAFRDDPVRLVRAFRLAGTLGFSLDPGLLDQVEALAPLLSGVAVERVRAELFGLLGAWGAADLLAEMGRRGLVAHVLPELVPTFTQPQTHYHHLGVWEHLLETIRQLDGLLADTAWLGPCAAPLCRLLASAGAHGRTRLQLLRLACLVHDVGKPQTASQDEAGLLHFYRHPQVGANLVRGLGARLRLSRREIHDLAGVVALHLRPLQMLASGGAQGRAGGRLLAQAGELAPQLLLLALADHLASRGPATTDTELAAHRQLTLDLLCRYFFPPVAPTPPPVNGNLLMARYQLPPGRLVGRLLAEIGQAHQEAPFASPAQVWEYVESHHPELAARRKDGEDTDR